ncbi:efflux RND transporter periplasmic adaptor subunit [Polycladidibacter stylochi]|uniref:efflux RND transporter periplasmic adaptor subunit n=1 Tax=Polycladidibacter stylochi TaxID=1807766 RepID=UPI00082B1234|nr:efflux RND transporter periplasmic adaptor subunit [Pseudovibrio stylochi]
MLHKAELSDKLKSLQIDRNEAPQPSARKQGAKWHSPVVSAVIVMCLAGISYAYFDGAKYFFPAEQPEQAVVSIRAPADRTQTERTAKSLHNTSVSDVLNDNEEMAITSQTIVGSGYVVADHVVTIKPEISGRIILFEVEPGDIVKKGQMLAQFDSTLLVMSLNIARSKVNKAAAEVIEAQAALAEAQEPVERLSILHQKGVVSKAMFNAALLKKERMHSALVRARRALATEELEVEKLSQQLHYYTIRAPFDGVVVTRLSEVGEVLQSGLDGGPANAGLVQVIDPQQLRIDIDIAEVNIAQLQQGQKGIARLDAYPEMQIPVTVSAIIPFASRQKGTVAVRLAIAKPLPSMFPNMSAKVTFKLPAN